MSKYKTFDISTDDIDTDGLVKVIEVAALNEALEEVTKLRNSLEMAVGLLNEVRSNIDPYVEAGSCVKIDEFLKELEG